MKCVDALCRNTRALIAIVNEFRKEADMRVGYTKKEKNELERYHEGLRMLKSQAPSKKHRAGTDAGSHSRSAKLDPSVTIISEFKGPTKELETANGTRMVIFSVIDTKTKGELRCKAFGTLAKRILQNASIRAGAVLEMSGQFDLYGGRLEFVVNSGRVARASPSTSPETT
jgi:hypothetical protein